MAPCSARLAPKPMSDWARLPDFESQDRHEVAHIRFILKLTWRVTVAWRRDTSRENYQTNAQVRRWRRDQCRSVERMNVPRYARI